MGTQPTFLVILRNFSTQQKGHQVRVSDIVEIINQMKGRMPESSRSLLAERFIKKIGQGLKERGKLEEWVEQRGPTQFMDDCGLDSGLPVVHHEIAVDDSKLAEFCNRWMNVEQYRDPDDGEWKPISVEMNQIRYTIVKELEALSEN